MNDMCIMPPKLFNSRLEQIIQKIRRKMESNARHAGQTNTVQLKKKEDLEKADAQYAAASQRKSKIQNATNLIDHFIE